MASLAKNQTQTAQQKRATGGRRSPKTTTTSQQVTEPKTKNAITEEEYNKIYERALSRFHKNMHGPYIYFMQKEAQKDPKIKLERDILINLRKQQWAGNISPRGNVHQYRDKRYGIITIAPNKESYKELEKAGFDMNKVFNRKEIQKQRFEKSKQLNSSSGINTNENFNNNILNNTNNNTPISSTPNIQETYNEKERKERRKIMSRFGEPKTKDFYKNMRAGADLTYYC